MRCEVSSSLRPTKISTYIKERCNARACWMGYAIRMQSMLRMYSKELFSRSSDSLEESLMSNRMTISLWLRGGTRGFRLSSTMENAEKPSSSCSFRSASSRIWITILSSSHCVSMLLIISSARGKATYRYN